MNEARAIGVDTASLVHALQNHDELTYELIHFDTVHAADTYTFRDRPHHRRSARGPGPARAHRHPHRRPGPYNAIFTTNGISSTTATVIAASLGLHDLGSLDPAQVEAITGPTCCWPCTTPGNRACSRCPVGTWSEPSPWTQAGRRAAGAGDTRWIHRSAYDLMDYRPEATESTSKMPRGKSLYGTLPDQLADPRSFARRLARHPRGPQPVGLATGTQLDVPQVSNRAMLVMVHALDAGIQVTALNFSSTTVIGAAISDHLTVGSTVTDMLTNTKLPHVDENHTLRLNLQPHQGLSLLLTPPERP